MKTVMVTGVAGVGKTTLVEEVARKLGLESGDYADLMLEVMGENDKDALQYLPWEKRRKIYDQVERLIEERFTSSKSGAGYYLFENHLTVIQDGRIITFPITDYRRYNMAGLVVVEAEPDSILARRQEDTSRHRRTEALALIQKQQEVNWQEAQEISRSLDTPCLKLTNPDNGLPVAKLLRWSLELMASNNAKDQPR